MENNGRSDMEGQNWIAPQCIKCKFNFGSKCWKFRKDRLEVPVDIFNCPEYTVKDKNAGDPKCVNCKFNFTGKCWRFQKNCFDVSVDIYNCPEFKLKENIVLKK